MQRNFLYLGIGLVAILLVAGAILLMSGLRTTRPTATGTRETPSLPTATTLPLAIVKTQTQVTVAPTATDTAVPQPTATEPTATDNAPTEIASTATPEPTPTIPPTPIYSTPTDINGVPLDDIAVLSDEVRAHVREIFALGQTLGRDPRAFSKLGDSLIATPNFLTAFDSGQYNLADFDYLQPVIDYYAGSFERYGVAVRPGLHSWSIFDPLWANKEWCQPNEDVLACEVRLNNPSVLLILMGSNDSGAADSFNYNLRKAVEYSLENGIIPVIVTKADRFEGDDNRNNIILRQIAADYQIPLWDFDAVAGTLPERGLVEDRVHLSVFPSNDYAAPEAFQYGHPVHNLTALLVLEKILQEIAGVETNNSQD